MPCSNTFKQGFFFLLSLVFSCSYGQKTIYKSFVEEAVDQIFIDANQTYKLVLSTNQSNVLKIQAEIEGEYSPSQLVNVFTDQNLLTIQPSFSAGFTLPNDKLSAHKILSVSLHIEVPKHMKVKLSGTSTNIEVYGDYLELNIELNDGNCTLNNVGNKVVVNTLKGTIKAFVDKATISAHSAYGEVTADYIPLGENELDLESRIGNIQLLKANN